MLCNQQVNYRSGMAVSTDYRLCNIST